MGQVKRGGKRRSRGIRGFAQLATRVPQEIADRVTEEAIRQDRSVASYLRLFFEEHFATNAGSAPDPTAPAGSRSHHLLQGELGEIDRQPRRGYAGSVPESTLSIHYRKLIEQVVAEEEVTVPVAPDSTPYSISIMERMDKSCCRLIEAA